MLWTQHHCGVFVSRDRGRQWTAVDAARPSGFGFAVAVHPAPPDTAWFVPAVKDERRVPVDARLVVSRTTDGGKTFDVFDRGLPAPSYDLVYRHALDVDPDGPVPGDGVDHRRPVDLGRRRRVVADDLDRPAADLRGALRRRRLNIA